MRRVSGFTLIELMITMAVIAILAAVAYPSYQDHIRRGIRSAGQQYLMDLAQREEQFFLDQKTYTNVVGAGGLNMLLPAAPCTTGAPPPVVPCAIDGKYQAAVVTVVAGPPPGFTIALAPVAVSVMAADGTLITNNLQQSFRDLNGDGVYLAGTDKLWTDR